MNQMESNTHLLERNRWDTANPNVVFLIKSINKCKEFGFLGSYKKEQNPNGIPMSKNDIDSLQAAVRQHLVESGPYSHLLINLSYADVLKEKLNCNESEFAKRLEMKNLSIVDGLEKDFVIIP